MVLGADADVSGWLEALGSKEGWEVISGETDRKVIDVIVLGSDGDVNADWLAAFKEKQTECLVLASRERVFDDEAWQQVRSVVDDLFDSRRELSRRPFSDNQFRLVYPSIHAGAGRIRYRVQEFDFSGYVRS